MRYSSTWIFGALLALSACGGGGSGGGGGPASIPAPPATGTPTGIISNTQTAANDLTKTSMTGINAVLNASKLNGVPIGLLGGFSGSSAKTTAAGVITSSNSVACGTSGTMSFTYTLNTTTGISAGDSATIVFTNCSFVSDYTINGTVIITFTRYVSPTDLAFAITTINLSSTSGGITSGPFNYTGSYDVNNNTIVSAYHINGITVVGQPVVTDDGTYTTIVSGLVHIDYGTSGWVEVAYNNWKIANATGKPVSGMITITAANGDSAVITASAGNYQVDITINGVVTSYNLPI